MKTIFWTAILISTLVVARARAETQVVCLDETDKVVTTVSFIETETQLTQIRGAYSGGKCSTDQWENVFVDTQKTSLISKDPATGAKTFNLSLEDGGYLPWTTYTLVIPAGNARRFEATLIEDDVHDNVHISQQITCERQ